MNAIARSIWAHHFGADTKRAVDAFGVTIAKASYGRDVRYGWEIDRICPRSRGSEGFKNMRPLNTQDTRARLALWHAAPGLL